MKIKPYLSVLHFPWRDITFKILNGTTYKLGIRLLQNLFIMNISYVWYGDIDNIHMGKSSTEFT